MKTPQNIQPSFDDEISIADMIHFFKSHKKMILIFVIIGALLGGLYPNFTEPVYKGSALISPAKISGTFMVNPKVTVTKLGMNSYYLKETFLNCNPDFYKDKDKDKDKDFDMSTLVKASVTKDDELIALDMEGKNKIVIENCLNSMIEHIRASQDISADPLFQSKNNELKLTEERLKNAEEFKSQLLNKTKEFKKNGDNFTADLLYTNMILLNSEDIKGAMAEINKLKIDLSSKQTKPANKVLPINIEKKPLLSTKLSALLGLFLGLFLGALVALIKKLRFNGRHL
jgi:LPS O-antigen subunit length determinant protein (WzzB/FepE family)